MKYPFDAVANNRGFGTHTDPEDCVAAKLSLEYLSAP
jgi:hypothetical protein